MKLHLHSTATLNTLTGYGPGWIAVQGIRYPHAVLVQPQGPVLPWPPTGMAAITAEDLATLAALSPELVLLGTGARQQFLPPGLLSGLHQHRIGIEIMDTGAACRTYNILVAEGRQVLAALLPCESPGA